MLKLRPSYGGLFFYITMSSYVDFKEGTVSFAAGEGAALRAL